MGVVKWGREVEGFVQRQHVWRAIGYKEMAVEYEPFPLCVVGTTGWCVVAVVGEVRPSSPMILHDVVVVV